jgi:nucleotide-binding universal stress UspA family protein
MSAAAFLPGMFLSWAVIGVASAVVMGRRGYSPFSWLVLGAALGPLVIPLAFSRAREARGLPRTFSETRQGPVDVLVGIDGSAESIVAANVVGVLLGERIGRLTLATVVDYDTALGGQSGPAHRAARLVLAQAADVIVDALSVDPDTVVLAGKPADAVTTHAADGRFDVLAVGCRGRGASRVVLGSVATRLSRGVHARAHRRRRRHTLTPWSNP